MSPSCISGVYGTSGVAAEGAYGIATEQLFVLRVVPARAVRGNG